MKGTNSKRPQEPVGIVISGWPRTPQPTVFAAYEYAPAPGTTEEDDEKTA